MTWEKAGKIAGEALKHGVKLAKPGIKLLELTEAIEKKIEELGGKLAFPVNLSLNHIAAHYAPFPNDETIFGEEDILKIDVGVHVDGFIGDTAKTVGVRSELIKASEDALKAAIKLATPGTKLRIIGRKVKEVIDSYDFLPIINLTGHGLDRYKVHSGIQVPNYDNGDDTKLEEGQVIAIEPFATDGEGAVKDGKPSGIYRLHKLKNTRSPIARQVLKFVSEEFRTLPFSKRAVLKKIPTGTLGLIALEREEIIYQYDQLPERSGGFVSQAEHTVRVKDKPEVLTKV